MPIAKSIKSVFFFNLSLVDIVTKTSYMMHTEQVVHTGDDPARVAEQKKKTEEGKKRAAAPPRPRNGGKRREKQGRKTRGSAVGIPVCIHLFMARGDRRAKKAARHKNKPPRRRFGLRDCPLPGPLRGGGYKMVSKLKSNAALYGRPADTSGKSGRPPSYGKKSTCRIWIKNTSINHGPKTV